MCEDEGLLVLEGAMSYLEPRANADEDEQVTGEYDAWAILRSAHEDITDEYQCRFCGYPVSYRRGHCSRNCYIADRENL